MHPHHHTVARVVAGWFTDPVPEIGYEVAERWWGYHCRIRSMPDRSRVILRVEDPAETVHALREIDDERSGEVVIWVDDRSRADRLDEGLVAAGCERRNAITHLALLGDVRAGRGPSDLVVEDVVIGEDPAASLELWATVKIRAFSDKEELPGAELLSRELAIRVNEVPLAAYQIARIGGEAVAVLAHYTGRDQLVFNLGTRLPFRHRGVAQAMLARWAAAGTAQGCRSLLINAEEGGRPAELYRRLGFVDEVYWYRVYHRRAR